MTQATEGLVKVWDPFVRVFHWSLVVSFAAAWVTAEDWGALHDRIGWFMLGLVLLRLLWGLIGTRHARFSDFVRGPGTIMGYLQGLRAGKPAHYRGHNPAGGIMVLALLLSLSATLVTGVLMLVYGEHPWEEPHEVFANLSLLLVAVHLVGVVVSSRAHGENLVKAMITGNKAQESENV